MATTANLPRETAALPTKGQVISRGKSFFIHHEGYDEPQFEEKDINKTF